MTDHSYLHDAIRRRVGIIEGPAMVAIVDERLKQIELGHDAEADAMLPIDALPKRAAEFLQVAIDRIRATGDRRDLPRARTKLAQAAALCIAALDHLPPDPEN